MNPQNQASLMQRLMEVAHDAEHPADAITLLLLAAYSVALGQSARAASMLGAPLTDGELLVVGFDTLIQSLDDLMDRVSLDGTTIIVDPHTTKETLQ